MIKLEQITENKKQYLDLLLLADPNESAVDAYLPEGEVFVLKREDNVLCQAVLTGRDDGQLELKNLATPEEHQCKGFAGNLIARLITLYQNDYEYLYVGTSNPAYYEKLGFQYAYTVKNFFLENYPEPIIDGGVQCIDMIYLRRSMHSATAIQQIQADCPYIVWTGKGASVEDAVWNLLLANHRLKTFEHSLKVMNTVKQIAQQYSLNEHELACAALLHDVSAIIKRQDMLTYARRNGWILETCEVKHPIILHQKFSSILAKEWFGIENEEVLQAISCHTTLNDAPSAYDLALFIADKLAWDQESMPPFKDEVEEALDRSLECAALAYIRYALNHGMILDPHPYLLATQKYMERSCGRN